MGAHSPAEKLLKHWLRIASVGSWAAESRAAKLVKRTFAFLISCRRRIEMLCVNVRRSDANRARSVLRWLGGIFV